jgi:hypothetical protein
MRNYFSSSAPYLGLHSAKKPSYDSEQGTLQKNLQNPMKIAINDDRMDGFQGT